MGFEEKVAQIKSLYEAEANDHGPVTSRDEIPFTYEMITPEWMTAVLCGEVRGAAVTAVRLDVPDNGTANRRRVFVDYNDAGKAAGLPASVFCKSTQGLINRINLGLCDGALTEVYFYNHIRGEVDLDMPRPYHANYDPQSCNSIILLDDIASDVEFCDQNTVITRDHVRSQLDLLSSMHSRFQDDPRINASTTPLSTWPEFAARVRSYVQRDPHERGVEAAEHVFPERLFRRKDEIWDAVVLSSEAHKRLPKTFVQGDCHLKQWYIRRDSQTLGLSDFQGSCFGHWARDVAYMMTSSLAIDDRRAWEKDLLAEYLEMMREKGAQVPSFDDAMIRYRQDMFGALNYWTTTLVPAELSPEDMQPPETSIKFIERMAVAIDDLDALDACKP